MSEARLVVRDLSAGYGGPAVISGVSLELAPGETLCVAGESGCGKSTLLKAILGVDRSVRLLGGSIAFEGREVSSLPPRERRRLWGTGMALICQSPGASFNPIRSYEKQLAETMKSHGLYGGDFRRRVTAAFAKLGLEDPEGILRSCPYEMSGGMNQRIAIAAAMLLSPRLLLADEPTSALDVTVQKQVADEMMRAGDHSGAARLIVTHNLGLAAYMADKIAVMYAGRFVEYAPTRELLSNPAHPYTRCLIDAIPSLDGTLPTGLEGRPPLYGAEDPGCAFRDRCPRAGRGCEKRPQALRPVGMGHWASCGG